MACFGLVEHGGGVDFGPTWAFQHLAGLKENSGTCLPFHGRPHGVSSKGGVDGGVDFLLARHVDTSDDVAVVVRHDLFNHVAGEHLFTVDDARNFEHLG